MKLVATNAVTPEAESDIETFVVSPAQFDYLGRVANEMNPDMPMAFAGAHVIRALLERFEDSGINLTGASSEEELTQIAARGMRQRARERCRTRG
ncbi:MAG: hypothetical protein ACXW2F_00310 [Thermoanaerobaculia bacterium]